MPPLGFIGLVAGCLVAWKKATHNGIFDDTYWHQAAGRWMLDHHQVMRSDVFSYTVAGRRWTTPEWGYAVLLAESVRTIGSAAFWLLSAGVASVTVACVAIRARLEGSGWVWTGLLCGEAGLAIGVLLDVRPQVVSYLLFAVLVLALRLARRRVWVLWALPPLFVVWANVHGSFLLGLGVVALEFLVAVVRPRWGRIVTPDPLPVRPVAWALAASAAATFVNPFGPAVYGSAFGVSFNSQIRNFIGEWQSPNFHDATILIVLVAPLVATAIHFATTDRPIPVVELALAAVLLVMTLDSARFLPYFAIAWGGLAARCTPLPEETLGPSIFTWPVAAALGFVMLQAPFVPAGQPASSVPVQAVSYLKEHPGRVFATYLWNDYLDWERIPVFIDGRTELYTDTPIFHDYLEIQGLNVDPDRILDAYGVRYVLWSPGTPLAEFLSKDPKWQVVRRTGLSVVFHRVAAPPAARTAP